MGIPIHECRSIYLIVWSGLKGLRHWAWAHSNVIACGPTYIGLLQELPVHQRGDAVSSMVYEANARVRDPVYGCVGAISSLQQQIDALQTQLALAQAEVVHLRVRQAASLSSQGISPSNSSSPSSKIMGSHSKSVFNVDMVVDQPSLGDSIWWRYLIMPNCYNLLHLANSYDASTWIMHRWWQWWWTGDRLQST